MAAVEEQSEKRADDHIGFAIDLCRADLARLDAVLEENTTAIAQRKADTQTKIAQLTADCEEEVAEKEAILQQIATQRALCLAKLEHLKKWPLQLSADDADDDEPVQKPAKLGKASVKAKKTKTATSTALALRPKRDSELPKAKERKKGTNSTAATVVPAKRGSMTMLDRLKHVLGDRTLSVNEIIDALKKADLMPDSGKPVLYIQHMLSAGRNVVRLASGEVALDDQDQPLKVRAFESVSRGKWRRAHTEVDKDAKRINPTAMLNSRMVNSASP